MRWRHLRQIDSPSFRLGNDLLCNDKDVILFKKNVIFLECMHNNIRQVVAVADEGEMSERSKG